jgi:hypothetical protein
MLLDNSMLQFPLLLLEIEEDACVSFPAEEPLQQLHRLGLSKNFLFKQLATSKRRSDQKRPTTLTRASKSFAPVKNSAATEAIHLTRFELCMWCIFLQIKLYHLITASLKVTLNYLRRGGPMQNLYNNYQTLFFYYINCSGLV